MFVLCGLVAMVLLGIAAGQILRGDRPVVTAGSAGVAAIAFFGVGVVAFADPVTDGTLLLAGLVAFLLVGMGALCAVVWKRRPIG